MKLFSIHANLTPPTWFRYGVMAATVLLLCSCQSAKYQLADDRSAEENPFRPAERDPRMPPADLVQVSYEAAVGAKSQTVVTPAIYMEDSHAAPPTVRMAEYAAGVRPEPCNCPLDHCAPAYPSTSRAVAGPRDEYLCDGGDAGAPAGVRADWQVDGLGPEDTIAHYDTVDGRTVVTPSNRVCIYAPRFGVVRRVVQLQEYDRYDMPVGFETPVAVAKIAEEEKLNTTLAQIEPTIHRTEDPASLLSERQQLGELDRELAVAEFDGSLAPYADLQIVRTGAVDNGEKALLARSSLSAISWSGIEAVQITIDNDRAQAGVSLKQASQVYHTEDPTKPRLRLIKLASTGSASPGDEVEFTLRYDNTGTQVMGNVTITDHLTTRLEYIDGSATSTAKANITTEPNDHGSVVLRWEIAEPVPAGQGGILQFKCRVR